MIVKKYGGTSVETISKIKKIARDLKNELNHHNKIIVVVSAMGKTTNKLSVLAKEISQSPEPREFDQLISTGENVSSSLLAIALKNLGVNAISLIGSQIDIQTNSNFCNAFVESINTEKIQQHLKKFDILIVTGFQGVDKNGNITTLGRGGSDTTATLLASVLKCDCEIFTDVSGIYTVDPKLSPKAKQIKKIDYNTLLEMSANGAKVMETRSLEIAKNSNINLWVGKSGKNIQKTGTKIFNMKLEQPKIENISSKEEVYILKVAFKKIEQLPQIYSCISINNKPEMLNLFKEKNFEYSALINNPQLINKDYFLKNKIKYTISKQKTKISLIGNGFYSHPKIINDILNMLIQNKIVFSNIQTTELTFSFLINPKQKTDVISLLSQKFNL